jgi:pyridoxal phosphate enzyme (YggS family)
MSESSNPSTEERREQLAANLVAVRTRIAAACAAAGRGPDEVTMIAVTKTYPADDVLLLGGLGVTDVGENRDQEAAPKAVAARASGVDLRWHFIGQLQRNKCRSVVTYADMVHSVDSVRLADALGVAAQRLRNRPLDVLLQVSLDEDPVRGGAVPDGADPDRNVSRVAEAIAGQPSLRLAGVMAVAPLHGDPAAAFARLAGIAAALRADYPDARVVSAGMSGDLETAIAWGATHVRIGSALLGKRRTLG